MRPGVEVSSRAARPARGTATDNGVWFVTDFSERGPHDAAVKVTSLADFTSTYGGRVAYSSLFDALETFFAEGGAEAYVAREVGAAPVKAFAVFNDAGAAPALRIEALYAGDYANGATGGLSAEIVAGSAGGLFTVVVFENGVEVERFEDNVDTAAAVAALAGSEHVRGVDPGAVGDPAVTAETDLAGGTDDRASATDAEVQDALDLFTKDLGPGQVSAPGRTTTAVHTMLIDHARINNRTAYLDAPDSATVTTLNTAVDAIEGLQGAEYAGLFGSWYDIPGLTSGTTRAVPGSAVAAGLTALADGREGTSGVVPGGEGYATRFALGVRLPAGGLTDDDYTALNENGLIMSRDFHHSGAQIYGFRSISKDPDWLELTANRLRVSLQARLERRALKFVFRNIDSKGLLFGELAGEMKTECMRDFAAGALYGNPEDPDNPDEAFLVDTGNTVNTEATIEAREVRAAVYARFSKFAELVRLDIIKVPLSSPLAA